MKGGVPGELLAEPVGCTCARMLAILSRSKCFSGPNPTPPMLALAAFSRANAAAASSSSTSLCSSTTDEDADDDDDDEDDDDNILDGFDPGDGDGDIG